MSTYISEAFRVTLPDAEESETWYVVLMEEVPYYGGPGHSGERDAGRDHRMIEPKNTETCKYLLREIPAGVAPMTDDNCFDRSVLKWSGSFPIPEIGERVNCRINSLGPGAVEAYFSEHGYFGVQVRLEADPDWHRKQCKDHWHRGTALVFGYEIDRL